MMPCSNTAALLAWENRQERLERNKPTPEEIEDMVDTWIDRKFKEIGSQFLTEAFCESEDYAGIYRAWIEDDCLELGDAFKRMVLNYWKRIARQELGV